MMDGMDVADDEVDMGISEAIDLETPFFPYEDHFAGMIQQKKDDHSYRYFRKVNRQAGTFPMGADYTHGGLCPSFLRGITKRLNLVRVCRYQITFNLKYGSRVL